MKELQIVDEFKNLIPALTKEEYNMLEQSILNEGVRDPIVIDGDMIADGHNRYEICQKHKIEFNTVDKKFGSIEDTKIWIIENQLSRRNLNKSQLAAIGLEYEKLFSIKAEKRITSGIKTLDDYVLDGGDPVEVLPQGHDYPVIVPTKGGYYTNKDNDRFKDAQLQQFVVSNENDLEYNDPMVYFIQSEKGGDIKIGCSKDVSARLKQLQTSNSEKLRVTNVLPGGYEKEKGLKDEFKSTNKEGEWFKATQRLAEIAKAKPIRKITSSDQAGKVVGVSGKYIRMVKYIEEYDPTYLPEIINGNLNVNDIYVNIKKEERDIILAQQKKDIDEGNVEQVEGEFEVIVIDPPWPYGTKFDPKTRRVANPYPEMSIDEIKEIDLPAADDSILFLWTTHKFLEVSFELLRNWNYDYKATLVWNKEKIGMGHWFRMQTEFCLFGIKGKPFWSNTTERDIITEARTAHSRKPNAFYEMINKICAGRKLDYFARNKREGWTVYGNEI